jgi:hypothetical protein
MLYIVGNGYARAELERLVRDLGVEPQVRFVGATPNEELRYWYSAADMQLPGQLERRLAHRLAGIHGLWHARGCGVSGLPEVIDSSRSAGPGMWSRRRWNST